MSAPTGSALRQHMDTMHYPYTDEGRVVNTDDYRSIIHELDHEDGRGPYGEGISVPHEHEGTP